ncbi:hypothetical protein GQ457_17G009150 [Hibiscus cannabinus]
MNDSMWRLVWHVNVPQRVRVFLWLLFHGRILMNVECGRRHLTTSLICPIYGLADETIEHVMPSCAYAQKMWRGVVFPNRVNDFLSIQFDVWLSTNDSGEAGSSWSLEREWPVLFVIICWMLWKHRCSLIFSQDVGRFRDVVSFSQNFRDDILAATINGSVVHTCPRSAARWTLPLDGWVKGNSDGAVGGPDRMVAAGGVLCGDTGECFRKVELETDNSLAVEILLGHSLALNSSALVSDLKAMIGRRWEVRVTHILREANRVADGLASLARGEWHYIVAPLEVSSKVDADLVGL